MKIIGGEFRSRNLFSPKGELIRPTTGVIRQAIFNICQNRINGANFLDLFAGSGSVGFEALSRGAALVTFVDANKKAIQLISKNIERLNVKKRARIFGGDVFQFMSFWARKGESFDIIYIDPPYDLATSEFIYKLLLEIEKSDLLKKEGDLFVERAFSKEAEQEKFVELKKLSFKRVKRFGKSLLYQFYLC